jgi:5-hydroxyisourate hydrolase
MSALTTHVLDTARGRPAAGVAVTAYRASDGGWILIGQGITDADGRCRNLLAADVPLAAGRYRLCFETGAWFHADGVEAFHPDVNVTFEVRDSGGHYHVPLLVSPFGYTTYRGS